MRNNIRELLIKNNMKEKELAVKLGMKEVTISRYINDIREPKVSTCIKIAKILNCRVEDLYCDDEQSKSYTNNNSTEKVISVDNLIRTFEDMSNRGTLLVGSNVTQRDLFIQIIGAITKVSMEEE